MAASVFKRVHDLFCRQIKRRRDLAELSLLDGREFSDLGISASDARLLVSAHSDVGDRLAGMTTRLGLDYSEVMEPRWRAADIARTCSACTHRRACRRYLAGHGPRADYLDFCPNAQTFSALADATHH